MTVKSILATKGRRVTVGSADMTMMDVSQILAGNNIGALVITDGAGVVTGIISERDVVREIADRGPAILRDPVAKHMTRNVVTCQLQDPVELVMQTMTRGRFRHMPVVEGGRLIGIVSIGDLVVHRMAEVEREADHLRSYIASA